MLFVHQQRERGTHGSLRLAKKTEFDLLENVWTVPKEHSKMGNVIRRPIFEQIKPFLEKAMTTYNDVLFPGEDIKKTDQHRCSQPIRK